MSKVNRATVISMLEGVVSSTLQESGPAPSGMLYLAFMQHGISLQTYEEVIANLIKRGIVKQQNHVLSYIPQLG